MTLSVAGIAVSVLTVIVIFYSGGFEHRLRNHTATGNFTLDDDVRMYRRLHEDELFANDAAA